MKKVSDMVRSVEGIEDLAAILNVSFQEAFAIAQRIRNENKKESLSSRLERSIKNEDTVLYCDLTEIRKLMSDEISYP